MDANVIENLGITHILNISDTCENYLEQSHPYLKYLHMCLHDKRESKIDLAFRELFCFIDETVLPDEISPLRREKGKSLEIQYDDSYPISNQLISINYKA